MHMWTRGKQPKVDKHKVMVGDTSMAYVQAENEAMSDDDRLPPTKTSSLSLVICSSTFHQRTLFYSRYILPNLN